MTITIHQGDCRTELAKLPAESVNCCVTSPPYYGLRNYGVHGQIGLEVTHEAYIAEMVKVFAEVRRVLRDDGTLWLNLGDSYASGKGTCHNPGGNTSSLNVHLKAANVHPLDRGNKSSLSKVGLKPKDLIGIPWAVAFALRADGWYLRQDIIWHKPNPMPESVEDRCTKAHEYLFLMTKSERYYFNQDAIKDPLAEASIGRADRKERLMERTGVGTLGKQIVDGVDDSHAYAGLALGRNGRTGYDIENGTRNKRSVWEIATHPYKAAHFATFPPKLIEPCILAGCPEGGTVLDPFLGSGTTALVADRNGCNCVGIELNPEYIKLANERLEQRSLFTA